MRNHYPLTEAIESSMKFDETQIITDDLCDTIYISSMLRTEETYSPIQAVVAKGIKWAFEGECDVIELENTNNVWARDYMPVQITANRFWKYVYNPNYLQSKTNLPTITDFNNVKSDIRNQYFSTSKKSEIIADGGNVVKCDSYIIMTDKVFVEAKNITKDISWITLRKELGVDVVIIPRNPADRLGHADRTVRYAGPNRVLFRAPQDEEDKEFMDDVIQQFKRQKPDVEVFQLDFSSVKKPDRNNWCYISFLRVGNHIVVPQLSEENVYTGKFELVEEDSIALEQLHQIFPQCTIQGLQMRHFIERSYGALNSLTWTIKSLSK
ncbi:MAG: agmatine deiminase family protein [Prevotella sp.]|nr:agmatine deiminase family protein [Prevotella sp.]